MQALRTASLLSILLLGGFYLYLSFLPAMRFADPAPDEPLDVKRNYPCYHDKIYNGDANFDALFFGASKVHHALDADLTEQAYKRVTGEDLEVFAFDTPESNPELVYFFFRDYLANNVAPETAFFSLTSVGPRPPPVRYIHPLFPDLAPPYLYRDALKARELVAHPVFAWSDLLQLLVRHIDLSLSRLLTANVRFTVPGKDNCETSQAHTIVVNNSNPSLTFNDQLAKEFAVIKPELPTEEIGSPEILLNAYANVRYMPGILQKRINNKERLSKQLFWRRGSKGTALNIEYYQRIVALGREHNVRIGFFFLPNIMAPEPRAEEVTAVSTLLGAPVYILPYEYTRSSYHHYKDPSHVKPIMRPAYAAWFASLVDQLKAH